MIAKQEEDQINPKINVFLNTKNEPLIVMVVVPFHFNEYKF